MHRASLRRQILKLAPVLLLLLTRPAWAQSAAAVAGPWDAPAAALAAQIADLLGPGPAQLTLRNLSSISSGEIPPIRRLLEKDLQSHGVQVSSSDAANSIRITLSEDLRERLWIAEVIEGKETRIAMVRLDHGAPREETPTAAVTLRKQNLLTVSEPVLAALDMGENLILIEPQFILHYTHASGSWKGGIVYVIAHRRPLPRDARAVVVATPDGRGFRAALAGQACEGSFPGADPSSGFVVRCYESDDPWPIALPAGEAAPRPIRAFANAARNYFTGVVTPSLGLDLPPFYTAALIPRPDGAGLLINGIDGKVQLVEANALKPIAGARDWGSDFAVLYSGCGAGSQVIVSGSGEQSTDSLRAYELPALEAVPVSAPVTVDGTVTALSTAQDGKSLLAIVRTAGGQGQADEYEVDRVTANCN